MAGWLLFVHLAALLVLPLLPLPVWLTGSVVCVLAINLYCSWRRLVWRTHPDAIHAVSWLGTDEFVISLHSGRDLQASLAQSALILPWLVILQFRITGHPRRILLLTPDMLPTDTFRRLRVRLRMAMDGIPA
jgi:hypothetical protein